MKTKLITGRYKGYEVCYANKGQIFPRDGWYLMKGNNVIYIEDAIAKTREETIREVEKETDKISPAYEGEALDTNNNRRWYEQGFGEFKGEIKQSLSSLR